MIPKSLSASALQVANACMSRYYAESVLKVERPLNKAASLGTAVHAALEWYVKAVYIEKTKPASLDALLALFRMFYCAEFETVEPDDDEFYQDGVEMLKRWFERTSFENRKVISSENKTNFLVKTSAGDIPLNYIWDRFDQRTDEEDTYEVVDYKTIRAMLSPKDLHGKIQARVYGLAGQIQVPTAKRIWVRFDLLRHDSVATVFTREQNIATWNFIKAMAEKIIATDPALVTETLNPECNFCVRKTSCNTLQSNATGGGVFSHLSVEKLGDIRARMTWQIKALKQAMDDIDELILAEASEREQLEFEGDLADIKITQTRTRGVDAQRVSPIVGAEIFSKYGGPTITMDGFTKLLKDPAITPAQKAQLQGMIYIKSGDPYIKVTPKAGIEDD